MLGEHRAVCRRNGTKKKKIIFPFLGARGEMSGLPRRPWPRAKRAKRAALASRQEWHDESSCRLLEKRLVFKHYSRYAQPHCSGVPRVMLEGFGNVHRAYANLYLAHHRWRSSVASTTPSGTYGTIALALRDRAMSLVSWDGFSRDRK